MTRERSSARWRYSYGYHYYEDSKAGYGYVHPASETSGGGYLAAVPEKHKLAVTTTLKAGKQFVERALQVRRPRAIDE